MVRIWRQGDVIIREVSEIPRDAQISESNVVKISSETGNSHVLKASRVFTTLYRNRSMQLQYVLLDEPSIMTHPQHPTLHLSAGTYSITTVRDYAPPRRFQD
jgi:hypothetical protein